MIAMTAAVWRAVAALMLAALAACQPGGSGRLMPDAGPGVTLSRASVDGDVATIAAPSLTVSIRGFWASNGGQGLYVSYRNTAKTTVRVPMGSWSLSTRDAAAPLDQVLDVTGTDVATVMPTADDPRRLYQMNGRPARELVVLPGATRSLSVGFARFGPDGCEPVVGSKVAARVPLTSTTATIRFTCAGGAVG